jgi:hypothetical protein
VARIACRFVKFFNIFRVRKNVGIIWLLLRQSIKAMAYPVKRNHRSRHMLDTINPRTQPEDEPYTRPIPDHGRNLLPVVQPHLQRDHQRTAHLSALQQQCDTLSKRTVQGQTGKARTQTRFRLDRVPDYPGTGSGIATTPDEFPVDWVLSVLTFHANQRAFASMDE